MTGTVERKTRRVGLSPFFVFLVLSVIVTGVLYGRTVTLPFYSDDLVQLPWIRELSFGEVWKTVSPYDYYRPLSFSLWYIFGAAGDSPDPLILRLINFAAHVFASSLIGMFVYKLHRNRFLTGVIGSLLFAAYPFAYQAVPWVSAVFYPLVVAIAMFATLAYLYARETGSKGWLVASVMATLCASLVHENGMLTGLLVAALEVTLWLQNNRTTKLRWWPALHVGVNVLFLILWLNLRRGGVSTFDFSLSKILANGAILSLSVSYPIGSLLKPVAENGLLIWLSSLVIIGLLLYVLRRRRYVGLFCLAWLVINAGPVVIAMRPEWLSDAPRFLYPAGAGAVMLWALALGEMALDDRQVVKMSVGLVSGFIIVTGGLFAYQGVAWHRFGAQALSDAVSAADEYPAVLYVNLPNKVAPSESAYPYFSGGAELLPALVDEHEIAGAALGETRDIDRAVTAGFVLPDTSYAYSTYGQQVEGAIKLRPDQRVYVTTYAEDSIRLLDVGGLLAQPDDSLLATFGEGFHLLSADIEQIGEQVKIILRWYAEQVPSEATMFVHVVDGSGGVVAQADGDALLGLYPLWAWQDGQAVEDVRYVTLPTVGEYDIYVGVWIPAQNVRLSVVDKAGSPQTDDRFLITPAP